MHHNLLLEPTFTCSDGSKRSLPGLLADMAKGEEFTLTRLRSHHRPAWHMFAVQLAVLAMSAANTSNIPEDEKVWVGLLRGLTPNDKQDSAWHLIVGDESKPAFFQAPDPDRIAKSIVKTPDGIDMLATSKNHDVKTMLIQKSHPEDWAFALIQAQTMSPYNGRGNYGIIRMNGGSSSRLCAGVIPLSPHGAINASAWWRRDVQRSIDLRSGGSLRGPCKIGGEALLWISTWKEAEQIDPSDMDPMALEICRRIRLYRDGQALLARKGVSKKERVAGKDTLHGALGDYWCPTETDGNMEKAFTLSTNRIDHRRAAIFLLGQNTKPAEMQTPSKEDVNVALYFGAMSSGNCKTAGFQERIIPVPRQAFKRFGAPASRTICSEMLVETSGALKSLKRGIIQFMADKKISDLDLAERKRLSHEAESHCAAFQRDIDEIFFHHLFERISATSSEIRDIARNDFVSQLVRLTAKHLHHQIGSIPKSTLDKPKAAFFAEEEMYRALRKHKLTGYKEKSSQ